MGVVEIATLERALRETAERLGVRVIDRVEVRSAPQEGEDSVRVETTGGRRLEAR